MSSAWPWRLALAGILALAASQAVVAVATPEDGHHAAPYLSARIEPADPAHQDAALAVLPPSLDGDITDRSNVLTDETEIRDAFARLYDQTGTRMYVLFLPTTDGEDISDFIGRVADRNADLFTTKDALLVIATDDRRMSIITGEDLNETVDQSELDLVRTEWIRPRLVNNDWSGGAAAAALGLLDAITDGAGPLPTGLGEPVVTGDQTITDVGVRAARPTFVTAGATVRSIIDPNLASAHYFAVDLGEGDRLRLDLDTTAPGVVSILSGRDVADSRLTGWQAYPAGGFVGSEAGIHLVRYEVDRSAGASRYALTFRVEPAPPTATLPPDGTWLCGRIELGGQGLTVAPGLPVCAGAIVSSRLSADHPAELFALEVAWGETFGVRPADGSVILEFSYPRGDEGPPEWYPLPEEQLSSESGVYMVRVTSEQEASTTPYEATFWVRPADPGVRYVLDLELAPDCTLRWKGMPIKAQDHTGERLLIRATDTSASPQGLVVGPLQRLQAGDVAGMSVLEPALGATRSMVVDLTSGGEAGMACLDRDRNPGAVIPITEADAP